MAGLRWIAFLALTLYLAAPAAAAPRGAVDPAVTQATIATTICQLGYMRSVRPPSRLTTELKRRQMESLGLPGSTSDYEEDHLIPLELGGAPRDLANLWPEPYAGEHGARVKDKMENRLHKLVCSGEVSLDDARRAVGTFASSCRRSSNGVYQDCSRSHTN